VDRCRGEQRALRRKGAGYAVNRVVNRRRRQRAYLPGKGAAGRMNRVTRARTGNDSTLTVKTAGSIM
jgi:hypothetical protein